MNSGIVKKYAFVFAFFTVAVFSFAQDIRVIGVIPKAGAEKSYQLQVGAFRITSNADAAAAVLTRNGFSPMREKTGGLTRVFIVVPAAEVRAAVDRLGRAGFREVVIREYIAGPTTPPAPDVPLIPPEPVEPKVEEPAPPEVVPEEIVLPEAEPEEFVPPVEEVLDEPVVEEIVEEPPVTEPPLEYEDYVFESEEPEHDLLHLKEAIH